MESLSSAVCQFRERSCCLKETLEKIFCRIPICVEERSIERYTLGMVDGLPPGLQTHHPRQLPSSPCIVNAFWIRRQTVNQHPTRLPRTPARPANQYQVNQNKTVETRALFEIF